MRYSSSDLSSPVLDETSGIATGSINALLKAVLVDGYGAKVAAGWTLTNTGTSTMVFQNAGSGSKVIVTDFGAYARVGIAKTVASIEPTVGTLVSDEFYIRKTADSVVEWAIVATDTYFYIFIDTAANGNYSLSFVGDIISLNPTDEDQFMVFASASNDAADRTPFLINTIAVNDSINNIYSAIIQSDTTVSASCGILTPFRYDGLFSSPVGGGNLTFTNPNPANAGLLASLCAVCDGSSQVRGFLPDAYYPWHQIPLIDAETRSFNSQTIEARNYWTDETSVTGEGDEFLKRGQIWLVI